jgi:putative adhesin
MPSKNLVLGPWRFRLRAAKPRYGATRRSFSHDSRGQAKAVALLLGALGALAACDVKVRDGKASFGVFNSQATEEWNRHYPLVQGGQIEIVNVSGPVEVTLGPAGFVDVHVASTAKAFTDAGAKELLSRGQIQETVGPAHIKVVSVPPSRIAGGYEARYEVRVPADAEADISTTNGALDVVGLNGKLKASTVNGRIELTDVGGGVDASAVNGSLTVRLARVTAGVRLETTNGRVSLEIPASSKANLSARTVNGPISVTGLPVETPTDRRMRRLEAALNGGGPEIDVRTTNGRISIDGK